MGWLVFPSLYHDPDLNLILHKWRIIGYHSYGNNIASLEEDWLWIRSSARELKARHASHPSPGSLVGVRSFRVRERSLCRAWTAARAARRAFSAERAPRLDSSCCTRRFSCATCRSACCTAGVTCMDCVTFGGEIIQSCRHHLRVLDHPFQVKPNLNWGKSCIAGL